MSNTNTQEPAAVDEDVVRRVEALSARLTALGADGVAKAEKLVDTLERPRKPGEPIVLKYPVSIGTLTVTELKLRRMKAKDMRGIGANGASTDDVIRIAARLSGQLDKVIDELDVEDFMEVSSEVLSFIGDGQATGQTS